MRKASHAFESLGLGPEAAVFRWNRPPYCGGVQLLWYPVQLGLASIAMTDDAVEASLACERKAYFRRNRGYEETGLVTRRPFPWIGTAP